jgi:hypothetical protein
LVQALGGGFAVVLTGFDADSAPTGLAGGVEGAAGAGEQVEDETAGR